MLQKTQASKKIVILNALIADKRTYSRNNASPINPNMNKEQIRNVRKEGMKVGEVADLEDSAFEGELYTLDGKYYAIFDEVTGFGPYDSESAVSSEWETF